MNSTRKIAYAGLLGALYVVLTYAQQFLFPESTSFAIQFRASEALTVMAFYSPSAIWGLTVGCLLFNISNAGALPLDWLVGTLATFLATGAMYLTRKVAIKKIPFLGLLMPALFNALLVGWELTFYIGGGFWINALYVALGELGVLLTLGVILHVVMVQRGLDKKLPGGR